MSPARGSDITITITNLLHWVGCRPIKRANERKTRMHTKDSIFFFFELSALRITTLHRNIFFYFAINVTMYRDWLVRGDGQSASSMMRAIYDAVHGVYSQCDQPSTWVIKQGQCEQPILWFPWQLGPTHDFSVFNRPPTFTNRVPNQLTNLT
jgi:hypothetical protein